MEPWIFGNANEDVSVPWHFSPELMTRYLRSSAAAIVPALMVELCDAFVLAVRRRRGIGVRHLYTIASGSFPDLLEFHPCYQASFKFSPSPGDLPDLGGRLG